MAGEELARRIIENHLKKTVFKNDDGSKDAMYDLRIGSIDKPDIAIECTGAVDPSLTETWNIGPAKGPLKLSVAGDWHITITPKTRVKAIKTNLEPILKEMEERQIYNVLIDHWLKWQDTSLFESLDRLGITHVDCFRPQGSGLVHLGMPGTGGAVDQKGDSIPEWIGDFLSHPDRRDVLSKLHNSGADACHAFVIVTFGGAPWSVQSYLTGDLENLPEEAPDLPTPIKGVWIVSSLGMRGLRWDGNIWEYFDARVEHFTY